MVALLGVTCKRLIGSSFQCDRWALRFRPNREGRVKTAQTICQVAILSLWTSGCVPGGLILPVPAPHINRPAIYGVVLVNDRPAEGITIRSGRFSGRERPSCGHPHAETTTDHGGRFNLAADRSSWTVFWGSPAHGVAVCLSTSEPAVIWSRLLEKSVLPPFYPDAIKLTCHIARQGMTSCLSSLDDRHPLSSPLKSPGVCSVVLKSSLFMTWQPDETT